MGLTKQQEHWDLFELSKIIEIKLKNLKHDLHVSDYMTRVALYAKIDTLEELQKYCEDRWK